MTELTPIYTRDNCSFSCPLQWGLTVFWRKPETDDHWFQDLAAATEVDGIRLLGHRFSDPTVSQFAVSTQAHVSPLLVVQRVKGRLQHLVRDRLPKAFKGNYAIRSVGNVARESVERYAADQLGHHRMADPRVQARLARFQIERPEIDLSQPRRTSHGVYWYNLHLVLVHQERLPEIREEVLERIRDMIIRASDTKGYLLSRAGILADHVHLVLGCPIEVAPDEVALGFLNNLAYVHGMRPVYQYGGFIGTVGEYTMGAMDSETPPHGDKHRGGRDA
jgi:REP element-mobilizing transposase RayT